MVIRERSSRVKRHSAHIPCKVASVDALASSMGLLMTWLISYQSATALPAQGYTPRFRLRCMDTTTPEHPVTRILKKGLENARHHGNITGSVAPGQIASALAR
ncbi:Hypothetical protein Rmet_6091 (plasmid) [Cupriavidus metallidurans CH34]|uniref:Uncharacterized protein n=1 Tax=Cupriavidus metallidurans (strain ATCC 43123 / DSM 2839 / NBRC 102507 / CH34) TaxID=266264 RepID=Q1LA76_CUPMC|nr:Hypothetical protein Rmet_6091 [Cupriavidus metallidurans CH34]